MMRTGQFLRAALVAGGLAAFATPVAIAQASHTALDVDFVDPERALATVDTHVDLRTSDPGSGVARSDIGPDDGRRRVELSVAAGGEDSPLDVSISQRATLGANSAGDLSRSGHGSEVRVGRGLVRDNNSQTGESSTYVFVASDNEALTWRPGERSEFGGQSDRIGIESRAEIGDLSAGVTYERDGVQASLAYVERSESTRVGNQSFNQDQSFTGVTVTVRNAP